PSNTLARKLREAMNHGEMRGGILGLNLRMTEVTAAMARVQLKKAPEIMKSRKHLAERLSYEVLQQDIPIKWPSRRENCVHSFYCWAGLLKEEPKGDIPAPFRRGYLHPLYRLPAFATK